MRKMLLLVVAFFAMATTASAQFAQSNAGGQGKGGNIFASMPTDSYSRAYFGYNPVSISWSEFASIYNEFMPIKNGLSLGYLHGTNIVKSLPLFVEYGANLQWTFGRSKIEADGYDEKLDTRLNIFSLNVPVNVAFRFSFLNNDFSVTPYLGLNFRFNLGGTLKEIATYYEDGEKVTGTMKYRLFSKKDPEDAEEVRDGVYVAGMGDSALKRFQVGFNCGVAFSYREYSFGVGYVTDFNKIVNPDVDDPVTGRMGVTTISVGYNF